MKKKVLNLFMLGLVAFMPAIMLSSCGDDKDEPVEPENPENPDNPEPPDTPIATDVVMETTWEAYYFKPNYNDDPAKPDYGNYYIELLKGKAGMEGMHSYPLNEGDYILCLDFAAAHSADHHNPVLPEGSYRGVSAFDTDVNTDKTFSLVNTMALYNLGLTDDGATRIKYIKFKSGTIDVKHTAAGYSFDCHFKGQSDDTDWHFTFEGAVDIEDQSAIDDNEWGFVADINVAPKLVTKAVFDYSDKGYTNIMLRCFDADITYDGLHVSAPGNKLQFELCVPFGGDIVGTHKAGSYNIVGSFTKGERFGAGALGSYCERVMDNLNVRYALVTEGTLTITKADGDNYHIVADCKTPEGRPVKMDYTGPVKNHEKREYPTTNLNADVAFNAKACTDIQYFGDYYENGTFNYVFFLADENNIVAVDMLAATGGTTALPVGTYTIGDDKKAGSALVGSATEESITPSAYVRYDGNNTMTDYAVFKAGSITITREGEMYTFVYDFKDSVDGNAHRIHGSVTTALPVINDATQPASGPALLRARKGTFHAPNGKYVAPVHLLHRR